MIKAILINALTREITEINLPKNNLIKETYHHIGNECALVQTGAYFEANEESFDSLMVDEEGYFKEGLDGFYIHEKGLFYGNGVIWGCDESGETVDCKTKIQEIKNTIIWVDKVKFAPIRKQILNNL